MYPKTRQFIKEQMEVDPNLKKAHQFSKELVHRLITIYLEELLSKESVFDGNEPSTDIILNVLINKSEESKYRLIDEIVDCIFFAHAWVFDEIIQDLKDIQDTDRETFFKTEEEEHRHFDNLERYRDIHALDGVYKHFNY